MKSYNMIYAMKNEKLIHILKVESGFKCGCICSACGEFLIARKGSKMSHHFAHKSKDLREILQRKILNKQEYCNINNDL